MGAISLRRRIDPAMRVEVYEVKLDDEFLMSSMFTVAEEALADLALRRLTGDHLDVVVGGLGLGYTARAALTDTRVDSLVVVEAVGPVIEWHRRHLLPHARILTEDARARLVHGDFFAMAADATGFDPRTPARRFHAIILDIDHSPQHVLNPSHAAFYTPDGLRRLKTHLHPGGVFALWSNDPPETDFLDLLGQEFRDATAEVVSFHNPLQQRESTNTVYLATAAEQP